VRRRAATGRLAEAEARAWRRRAFGRTTSVRAHGRLRDAAVSKERWRSGSEALLLGIYRGGLHAWIAGRDRRHKEPCRLMRNASSGGRVRRFTRFQRQAERPEAGVFAQTLQMSGAFRPPNPLAAQTLWGGSGTFARAALRYVVAICLLNKTAAANEHVVAFDLS